MNWEDLSLSDIRSLVVAIEQAGGPQAIRSIIERVPVEINPHGRVTLGTMIKLLDQLEGKTVLSNEDLQLIHRPDEPVIVRPTFAELMSACRFDIVDPDFTEGYISSKEDVSINQVMPFHLGKDEMNVRQTIRELIEVHNFHLVGIRRALEWRAVNTGCHEVVVIIGGVKEEPRELGIIIVPYFQDGRARIDKYRSDDTLGSQCHFLVCER